VKFIIFIFSILLTLPMTRDLDAMRTVEQAGKIDWR